MEKATPTRNGGGGKNLRMGDSPSVRGEHLAEEKGEEHSKQTRGKKKEVSEPHWWLRVLEAGNSHEPSKKNTFPRTGIYM